MNLKYSLVFSFVLLCFPAGIAASGWGLTLAGVFILLALLILFFFALRKKGNLSFEKWIVFAFGLCLFGGGMMRMHIHQKKPANDLSALRERTLRVSGYLEDSPKKGKKTWSATVRVNSFIADGKEYPVDEKLRIFIGEKEDCPARWDKVVFSIHLHEIEEDSSSFNAWLRSREIFHQGKAWDIQIQDRQQSAEIWFADLRSAITQKMLQSASDTSSGGLASAMMTGDKEFVGKEIRRDYARAGLSHVLAVSGMHIALLFQVLWVALLPFLRGRKGRIFATVLCMILLALFGALAGWGGSVMRAVFMFECILLATLAGSGHHGLRGLQASVFFLLLYDPALLLDPGFQLSCAAVWGILAGSGKLNAWFLANARWMPRELSSSLAVTLAAQAATAPIVIWHFEVFPAWFIPANLVVVPISNYVMKFGFAALFLCWVPWLGTALVWILAKGVAVLTWITHLFANLPGAEIRSLSFSETGIWILLGWLLGILLLVRMGYYLKKINDSLPPTAQPALVPVNGIF